MRLLVIITVGNVNGLIVENVYKFKAQFKFAKRYFMCRSKTPDKKKDIFANSLKRKM